MEENKDMERYLQNIKDNLRRNRTSLELELEDIFEMKFSPEVDILDFVLIETPRNTDIMLYCMNSDGEEVCSGYGESCFAGSEKIIENTGIFNIDEDIDSEKIYSENPEVEHLELDIIKDWFLDAFKRAGGNDFKTPCYFMLEDDIKSFNLKSEKWLLNQGEKYI